MVKINTILKMISIVLLSMFLGTAFLTATYHLPTDKIHRHLESSVKFYELGGDDFKWAGNVIQTRLDNFTDSLMLMEAVYPTDKTAFDAALFAPSWKFINNSPSKTFTEVFDKYPKISSEDNIYPRYWHGYLSVLKPALYLFKLSDVRMLNFYLQFFLIVAALFLIYKRLGICYSYLFALAILVINPVTTAMCFQFSDILYLTLIAAIIMLTKNEKLLNGENYIYFFLIFGIATVYFDFLTYPITEIGFLICLYAILNKHKIFQEKISKFFKDAGIFLSAWFFGYAAMWIGKWLEVYLFSDYDIINDVFGSLRYRSSNFTVEIPGVSEFTYFDVIHRNVQVLIEGPLKFILMLSVVIFFAMIFTKKKKLIVKRNVMPIFFVIMAIPFLWYLAASNHSFVHPFLAYRNLSVTILGLGCLLLESAKVEA